MYDQMLRISEYVPALIGKKLITEWVLMALDLFNCSMSADLIKESGTKLISLEAVKTPSLTRFEQG